MDLSISKKRKPGRPRTDTAPMLVRFGKAHMKKIDGWKRGKKLKSRPAAVRDMVDVAQ
jgi:hypothetical protein